MDFNLHCIVTATITRCAYCIYCILLRVNVNTHIRTPMHVFFCYLDMSRNIIQGCHAIIFNRVNRAIIALLNVHAVPARGLAPGGIDHFCALSLPSLFPPIPSS